MAEAVLLFGAMSAVFELILLGMLAPRTRLRVLGSAYKQNLLHVGFLLLNLMIHWGTLTGSMTAIVAFLASIPSVLVAKLMWGHIADDRYYTGGLIKYSAEELC